MDEFVAGHGKIKIDKTLESLDKHGFNALFCASRQEAVDFIVQAAQTCTSIGIAGTHTVRMLGVIPLLENAGKTVYDHWKLKIGTPEELESRRNQMRSDMFLSSVNALTMTGEIVNRDGCGNRINAMTFGPEKVVLVAGRNKIAPDLDSALARIEETAAPIRAMSLNRKTPCVKTGYCMDCDSPERICRITSIIHRKPMFTDISVLILDEDLGY